MHKCVMTLVSTLLALASTAGGSIALADRDLPKDILKQKDELARRMDALAEMFPEPPQPSAGNRLTQWYNWGNWRNGWGNWRNW